MATVKQKVKKRADGVTYSRPRKRANRTARRVDMKPLAVALTVVLLGLGIYAIVVLTDRNTTAPSGTPAPNFTLTDSQGRTFSLSDFRGKPVVLFFMTTGDWCRPCIIETRDHLVPLQNTFGNRIQIISLELLPNDESDADLNAHKATFGANWIYARDTANVAQKYGVTTLSNIIIVDQGGYIRYSGQDPSYDQMVNVLRSLGVS
jgi:peroxiredoxin